MNPIIASRWSELHLAKLEILDVLNSWSDAELLHRPGTGWSAVQVLEHIFASETGTLGYMRKKSSSGWEALELTGEDQVKASTALNLRLQSSERFAAPDVLAPPPGDTGFSQLVSAWDGLRIEMYHFFDEIQPVFYDRLVFRQPNAGMLNVIQTIEFLSNHIRHHIPQLERIKSSLL